MRTSATLATIALFLVTATTAFAEMKVGVVDAQKLLEESEKGLAVSARLEKMGRDLELEAEAMKARLADLEEDLLSDTLNEEAKEKKALELYKGKTELRNFVQTAQKEMLAATKAEMRTLQEEIKPIIKQVGKERGLAVVLELTAVAYFDPTVDITDDILAAWTGSDQSKK